MPDTFTGSGDDVNPLFGGPHDIKNYSTRDCILEDNKRLRAEVSRCLKFIRTIPDNQKRAEGDSERTAWTRELWAIKREVKA